MKKFLLVANWKIYLSIKESTALASWITSQKKSLIKKNIVFFIAPPLPALIPVWNKIKRAGAEGVVSLCAQDCSPYGQGAYTGEVSSALLRESGCRYTLLGHSERRNVLGENDETVKKKLLAVVSSNASLTPILCIGETQSERADGRAQQVIERQVKTALEGIKVKKTQKIIFAYEPTWAIGSGNAMDSQAWIQTLEFCRSAIKKYLSAAQALVLYGGSVSSETINHYMIKGCSGVLIGRASTNRAAISGILKKI